MAKANETSQAESSAHTAGPWKIETTGDDGLITVITSPDAEIATIYYPGEFESEEMDAENVEALVDRCNANARLIAAAPDLFDHLESLVEMARSVTANWENGDLASAVQSLERVADEADFVIDAARGKA